jgi:hypothetical protein
MAKAGVLFCICLLTLMTIVCCFAATKATVIVTAVILSGTNSITVDANSVNFGAVTFSTTNRRFIAGPITISYFTATNPWTIRVWTNNGGGAAHAGLVGADGTAYIPLKVWCDNYGPRANPRGYAPDEENTYFWNAYDFNGNTTKTDVITSGIISEIALGFDVNGDGDALDVGLGTPTEPVSEEPIWLRVPEYSEMAPGNPFTWRRLCYAGAELSSTGFPVYLAIDVTGKNPQVYSTATLTFQIINE